MIEKIGTPIGGYAPDFELPGTDGAVHHLARYLEQFRVVGVIIMGNRCPYVKAYVDRLKHLQAQFGDRATTLIGINANDDSAFPEDSFENMKAFATQHQLNFPYLRDVTQDVTRSFGAECTPEVFLLDQSGILQYTGAIDDNPQTPSAVQQPYLEQAIIQLLANEPLSLTATQARGGSIQWRSEP